MLSVACTLRRDWYHFVAVGLLSFGGGLAILIPARIVWYLYYGCKKPVEHESKRLQAKNKKAYSCFARIRAAAVNLLSGHTRFSKLLVVTKFLLDMISILIYLYEATTFSREECGTVRDDTAQLLYTALCVIFFINYLVRFIGSTDKLFFWLDVYSIVDHFTIGPTFYGMYADVNWIGLRFLRLLYLLQLPEVMQMMHIMKTSSSIRLTQIGSIFIAVWFASSGFVHIIENNGDPFHNYENPYEIDFWRCVYWLLVTMSTVGYGDHYPNTDLGRGFITIYIILSIAMFTAIVPELIRHLGRSTKFSRPYKRIYGKRHVVVCGHITYESVATFVRNFVHEDAQNSDINVVIVDSRKPDLELEAFFKRHMNDVTYLRGSVMDLMTLKNAKLGDAAACLILANRVAENPDEEDAANIMRATAIKNYDGNIRLIIQLLNQHNKTYLLHIPNWTWEKMGGSQDEVVCISELKLGLLAQNCLAPGVSTLISNLFTMRSYKYGHDDSWQDAYRYGSGNEIYVEQFSAAFVGMSFSHAVEVCFQELGILLIAIETARGGRVRLNPQNCTIGVATTGFFIAQAPEEVRRVTHHKPQRGIVEGYDRNGQFRSSKTLLTHHEDESTGNVLEYMESVGSRLADHTKRRPSMDELEKSSESQGKQFDYTGMFHQCPPRELKDMVLEFQTIKNSNFRNHVVLILMSDENSVRQGLFNFIAPLRTSNFNLEHLPDIVIMADPAFISKEWGSICCFPKVYVFNGTPSYRPDLRILNLDNSLMCVILSAKRHITVDQTPLDKEAILTCLNVKGMFGSEVSERIKALGVLSNPDAFQMGSMSNNEIPICTDLEFDNNVAFMDQDDDDDPDIPLYMTQPFASGTTFAASVLDSLMSAAFADGRILRLLRSLVTGGETAEYEQILAEGLGIVRKQHKMAAVASRARSRLALFHLNTGVLQSLELDKTHNTYGTLFTKALNRHGILCVGLYRLMFPEEGSTKRYVLAAPPADTPLRPTDKVYCLAPTQLCYQELNQSSSSNPLLQAISNGNDPTVPSLYPFGDIMDSKL